MANLAVTPDSSIRILKCPIRLDDRNQLTFSTLQSQTDYFLSLPYLYDNNLSYIRKDGVLRASTTASGQNQLTYEDFLDYNYCMYKNTHYEDKWFYAYISDVKYINDGCCELSLETDVYQTWMFDLSFKDSFIEREHVNNDTVGLHTVPENVEMGEYIENNWDYISELDDYAYMLCATTDPDGAMTTYATNMGGIPYNGKVYYCSSLQGLVNIINSYRSGTDYTKNIYAVYMIPAIATVNTQTEAYEGSAYPMAYTYEYNKPSTLNGYTPKNNKLLTFPYEYLLVSNNNGQSTVLKWEHFTTAKAGFTLTVIPTIGGDFKLTPDKYEGGNHYEEYAIIGGKLPTLSWSQDLFTSWISQNGVNVGLGAGAGVLSIVGGIGALATGAAAPVGIGMIGSGIGAIAGSMAQVYQHSMDATSFKGNVNGGSINVAGERNGIYLYRMSIKAEYARMIDDYFTMFGYKVNRIGTPHIHARTYYDYCKTIDIHLAGDIPENDMIKLRNLFNNGCTFWHYTNYFMNYSVNNSIL